MGAKIMGKHCPKIIGKRVKRKIFGPKMHGLIGKWITFNKEEM